jgi:hypothetical protein
MDHQYRIASQQGLRYPDARFDEKGCLQVWGGDALTALPKNTLPIHLLKPTCEWYANMITCVGMMLLWWNWITFC